MPSDKKRINLTVPDPIYDRLQLFKEKNGITNDASACLQLITKQLKAEENEALMIKLLRENSTDQLLKLSCEGLSAIKTAIDEQELLIPPAE